MENDAVPIFITAEIVLKTTSGKSIFTASEEELESNDLKLFFTSPQVIKEAVTALKQDGFSVQYIGRNSITVWGATARFENKFKVEFTQDQETLKVNGAESFQFKESGDKDFEKYKDLLDGLYLGKPSNPLGKYQAIGTNPPDKGDRVETDREEESLVTRGPRNFTPEEIREKLVAGLDGKLKANGIYGQNVKVAVIDGGLYSHRYFNSMVERICDSQLTPIENFNHTLTTKSERIRIINKGFEKYIDKIDEFKNLTFTGSDQDKKDQYREFKNTDFIELRDSIRKKIQNLVRKTESHYFDYLVKYNAKNAFSTPFSPRYTIDFSAELANHGALFDDMKSFLVNIRHRINEIEKISIRDLDHGTSVVSCLLAIAPQVNIRFYGQIESHKRSSLSLLFDMAIKTKPDIITCSLGDYSESFRRNPKLDNDQKRLQVLVNEAVSRGITVVFPAGNSDPDKEGSKTHGFVQGEFSSVISAGGITINEDNTMVASKISCGYTRRNLGKVIPEVCGLNATLKGDGMNDIESLLCLPIAHPTNKYTIEDGWGLTQGTSFCAPQIAGVCALIKQILPGATPEQIKEILLAETRELEDGQSFIQEIPVENLRNQHGRKPGLVNTKNAIELASTMSGNKLYIVDHT